MLLRSVIVLRCCLLLPLSLLLLTVSGHEGDTLVQLVPKPLPALSPAVQDQDLNVTLDETPSQGEENTHPETQQGHVEQDISGQGSKKKRNWFHGFLNDFVIDIMSKVLLHCFPFNYRYCIPVDCCQMLLFFIKIEKKNHPNLSTDFCEYFKKAFLET